MTTIAARRLSTGMWMIAADTQETREGEHAGDMKRKCKKLYRFQAVGIKGHPEIIVATAGESSPGLVFIDCLKHGREFPEWLRDKDIACLVLMPSADGRVRLLEYDQFCIPVEIEEDRYAIGTGAMAAGVALDFGATVFDAVKAAHKYDPYTGPDVEVGSLAPKS